MNKLVYRFKELSLNKIEYFGGKARSLGYLIENEVNVPQGSVITGEVYDNFVEKTGLRGRILIELTRKNFENMRWEEIWDASQRIRNMFNTTNIPDSMKQLLIEELRIYSDLRTAVRSSSIAEDNKSSSFAGLHDSYLNVKGVEEIISKMKLVWASLWSDASLLYRQELGLSIEESKMPVIIQEMVFGKSSGITFTKDPSASENLVIEAVYGLCKGLVDGTVEPDRWLVDRDTFQIISHYEPVRDIAVKSSSNGVSVVSLSEEERKAPPLPEDKIIELAKVSLKIENVFGSPQDIEWTILDNEFYIIQSRPITTGKNEGDIRTWYLSLKRSIDNLSTLEDKITNQILPEMIAEANIRNSIKIKRLNNSELIEEINIRAERYKYWHQIYWDKFIPMAHGVRLFGQIYNDNIKPDDPYEFIDLLSGTDMISTRRNNRIVEISKILKENPDIIDSLKDNENENIEIIKLREEIMELFGIYGINLNQIVGLITKINNSKTIKKNKKNGLIENYFRSFPEDKKNLAEKALKIGRKSWRLRDDDNIILGRFERLLSDSLQEAKKRLINNGLYNVENLIEDEIVLSLSLGQKIETKVPIEEEKKEVFFQRQIIGQPASPGLVTGSARVIREKDHLFDFKEGEVMVIDSIDPNMTFLVPLATGIIERRGGMLIHGAIIAREYGIPCVTGIPEATEIIKTGDTVTVDGYLGIVIIDKN